MRMVFLGESRSGMLGRWLPMMTSSNRKMNHCIVSSTLKNGGMETMEAVGAVVKQEWGDIFWNRASDSEWGIADDSDI